MNALRIGDTLFVHSSRKRGFLASLFLAAILLISLSVLTGFGLGREMLMVREAGLGTLYIGSFLFAMLAATYSSNRAGRNWGSEAETRVGGRRNLAIGLVLHPLFTAFWAFLFLVPFFVASLACFQANTAIAAAALIIGTAVLPLGLLLERSGMSCGPSRFLPALAGALAALPLLSMIPGGGEVARALALAPATILASGILPGAFAVILPGPPGWAASGTLFLLANMRQALVHHPAGNLLASLLPDLANLNPSLALTRPDALDWGTVAGAMGYAGLFAMGVLLVSLGLSRIGSDKGSLTQ